jgi:outer membrane receptor for ferrienterochelin and colicin
MIMSDISFITPINVKTIEYIDGVDASSYGSRGANGIIKITLKK